MNNIAIIPARSGSKGILDKNIKSINGKPLLAFSIEAAMKSNMFDMIMVSTDSSRYADIAKSYGAEVPFLRSKETSSDGASSWDAVEEVLLEFEKMGKSFDTFCLLQPTSPLRTASDIVSAYTLFLDKRAISVVSFVEVEHPIEWCGAIDGSLSLDGFNSRYNGGQRQKLGKTYRPNGAIYIVSVEEFRKDRFLYRSGSYAYIMPQERSVDIDNEFDFNFAEYLMTRKE